MPALFRKLSISSHVNSGSLAPYIDAPTEEAIGGGLDRFNESVTGTSDRSLRWTMLPALGILDPSTGLYAPPATVNGKQVTTVTVTSNANPTVL